MKLKHLLTRVAVMAVIGSGNAWAQGFTSGSTYYLQNVESGRFISSGATWGTKATLSPVMDIATVLEADGSNWKIKTQGTQYLGKDAYADQGAQAWTIEAVAGEANTYTVKANGKYLGNSNNLVMPDLTSVSDASKWIIKSVADYEADMNNAAADAPVNCSFYIKAPNASYINNPSYTDNWSGITGAVERRTNLNTGSRSGWTALSPYTVQIYNGTGTTSQSIKVTKAGVYAIGVYGFYRASARDKSEAYLYAGDGKVMLKFVEDDAQASNQWGCNTARNGKYVPNSNSDAGEAFEHGLYKNVLLIRVDDPSTAITIGIKKEKSEGGDWTCWDNFFMEYYGDVTVNEVQLATYIKAYNEAMTTATALLDEDMADEAKTALNNAITSNTVTISSTTKEELETAATNLNDAIAAAQVAIDKKVWENRRDELIAQGAGTDITEILVNAAFEAGTLTGWTSIDGGAIATNTNYNTSKFVERWKNGVALGNGSLTHDAINLPAGLYTIKIDAQNIEQYNKDAAGTGLFLRAAGEQVEIGARGIYSMLVKLNEAQDVSIAIVQDNCTGNWICYDNIQIIYEGEDFPALTAATGKMNATVATAQTNAIAAYNADKSVLNYNAATAAIAAAQASVDLYTANKVALDAQKELMDATNVYDADGFAAYNTAYETALAAYNDNTATEVVVNPNSATAWHATTAYNFLLTPWKLGESACNEFANALYINTWSTEGDTDGSEFTVPFFEYWVADDGKLGNNTLTGTVTGLDNGLYSATAWVRVRATNGVAATDATGISLSVNGGTAVDATEGTQVGESQFTLAEVTAEGLVKDGTLNISFDVEDTNISWLTFKNVKYTKVRDLTPEEQIVYATAEEIAAFNEAIEAAEAKTVGFKAGNYSPYANADAIKALADAKTIDTENPVDVEKINAAIAAIADENWTVNEEEVNAINNGDFEGSYAAVSGAGVSADRDIFLPTGWSFRKNGINTNDIVVLNTSDKAGNNVTSISTLENGGEHTLMYRGKWGNTTNLDFYQKITLPAGAYTLECDAWKSGLGGDGKIYVGADNEASLDGNATSWRKLSLTFTLDEEKTVEVGFNIKHNSDGSEKFIGFDNFTLYSLASAKMKVSETAKVGTFCAPFDVAVPAGVTASTATIDGTIIELEEVENGVIPANTPVILEAENGLAETTVYGRIATVVDNPTYGCLVGVYEETIVEPGNYVLQKHGEKDAAFYIVTQNAINPLAANRCYLVRPAGAPERLSFSFDNEATGIEGISAIANGEAEAVFNTSGVKQNGLQKGLNIVKLANGKTVKVMVK